MMVGRSDRMASLIGAPLVRREDPRLLTGSGEYLADVRIPGTLEAAFVRSPLAHAMVRGLDPQGAVGLDGVRAVLTAATLPDHTPLVDAVAIEGLAKTPQPPLAGERVRYVGEPIALVVAEDRYAAEDGAESVSVEFEELPAVTDARSAACAGAPQLFPDLGSNVVFREVKEFGDPAKALASARKVYRSEFHGGRATAVPMETRGCLASYDAGRGRLTVFSSTQGHHLLRRRLAVSTGLPESRVRVIVPDVGGGFGQKIPAAPEEVAVALASMALERPVRWIEDRRENLVAAPQAKEQIVSLQMSVDEAGRFRAMRAKVTGDAGAYSHNSASALIEPYLSALLLPSLYRIEHFECEILAVLTNKAPASPYRGVGWTASHTARELLIDQIAREEARDPAELRRLNMIRSDETPHTNVTGMVYDSGSFRESLDKALEMARYQSFRRKQESDTYPRRRGIGISPYVEPNGWGSAGAAQSHWVFASHDAARVTMDPGGHVTVAVGTPSQGQGHETTLAQLASAALGIAPEAVEIRSDDTDATPVSIAGTRASRTAVVTGGAVVLASGDVRSKLLRLAGHLLEASECDLDITDGMVHVTGDESTRIAVADVAAAAHFDPAVRTAEPEPMLSSQRFHDPDATYSNGCVVATVELDLETGAVVVVDLVAVEDCGRIINPLIVEGQLHGAAAQALGYALLEEVAYSASGQVLTSSLMDYLVPTCAEVPTIRIGHIESPSPNTVLGVKGMGESGMIAVPAAIANAVADAVPGHPLIDRLPITPDLVAHLASLPEAGQAR